MKPFYHFKLGATAILCLWALMLLLSISAKSQDKVPEDMDQHESAVREAFYLHQMADFISYSQLMISRSQKFGEVQIAGRDYKFTVTEYQKPTTIYRRGNEYQTVNQKYLVKFSSKSRKYSVLVQENKIEFNSENLFFFGIYNTRQGEITLKSKTSSHDFVMYGFTYEFDGQGLGKKIEDWVVWNAPE